MIKPEARVWVRAAAVLLTVLAWLALGPRQFGGGLSYVVIAKGDSMEPQIRAGDLALLRATDRPEVGQVVAYRSPELGRVVLHRIVDREGDRFVLQGDNNPDVDPERPGASDLIGSLWLHIPKAGTVLLWLADPRVVAMAVALLFLMPMGGARRRRKARAGPDETAPPSSPRPEIVIGALLVGVALIGLSGLAFAKPLQSTLTTDVPYQMQTRFSYEGSAPSRAIYGRDGISLGDPIFAAATGAVHFSSSSVLSSASSLQAHGRGRILITLSADDGYSRRLTATAPMNFIGDRLDLQARLSLVRLNTLIDRVERGSGVIRGAYGVEVSPVIRVGGRLDGTDLSTTFRPTLSFRFDRHTLSLAVGDPAADPSLVRDVRTEPVSRAVPGTLSVGALGLRVAVLRWAWLPGAVLLALALLMRPTRFRSDTASRHEDATFGNDCLVIDVEDRFCGRGAHVVGSARQVESLARYFEAPILRVRDGDVERFVVETRAASYAFRTTRQRGTLAIPARDTQQPTEEPRRHEMA